MKLHIFDSDSALAEGAASFIAERAAAAIQQRGRFDIALSGGSSPQATYSRLAQMPVDWQHVHVFWGDERCVSPEHPDSDYGMTKRVLLDRISIPEANIHRMRGEIDPAEAAADYSAEIVTHSGSGLTSFDLILLGLGDDGHTASLFPETDAVKAGHKIVSENYVPKLDSWRITFTYPLINAAREVAFLVNGSHKAAIVKEVIEGEARGIPAKAVQPRSGELHWLLDASAAALLTPR
jgi:6-phosphogluconolactonase